MSGVHETGAVVMAAAGFLPTRDAPSEARVWLRALFVGWAIEGPTLDVLLVLSELVTNAVMHGAGVVDIEVVREPGVVRMAVCDQGGGIVRMCNPRADSVGGRGLVLVDHLAESWGVLCNRAGGKTVWASLHLA